MLYRIQSLFGTTSGSGSKLFSLLLQELPPYGNIFRAFSAEIWGLTAITLICSSVSFYFIHKVSLTSICVLHDTSSDNGLRVCFNYDSYTTNPGTGGQERSAGSATFSSFQCQLWLNPILCLGFKKTQQVYIF